MTLEPADREWRSMRIAAWEPLKRISGRAADSESGDHDNPNDSSPVPNALSAIVRDPAGYEFIETNGVVSIEAEHFKSKQDRNGAGWEIIPGLGRTGDSVAVFPTTAQSIATNRLTTDAPRRADCRASV